MTAGSGIGYPSANMASIAARNRVEVCQRILGRFSGPQDSIYRLRVGTWRIIYAAFDREQLVMAGKVAGRSEDTYHELGRLF